MRSGNESGERYSPPLLSEKEARGTVTRLHETGFFARVTPIRHGRKTFYSIRLMDSELRAQLLARLTYSKNFADERRKKDKELADQIRVQKGDYNSELEKGQREGDAEATGGRREGDYDKKPLNRKPFNRNPHNNAHQHPLAPSISDSESAFLNTYNRFARSHKALGFLEVHILTDEVQKALEIFEDYDPDDFLEVLEEEANDPEGGRTFVRCCWTTIKGARERETNDIHERAIKGGPREMSFHRDQVSESVGSLQSWLESPRTLNGVIRFYILLQRDLKRQLDEQLGEPRWSREPGSQCRWASIASLLTISSLEINGTAWSVDRLVATIPGRRVVGRRAAASVTRNQMAEVFRFLGIPFPDLP
jgi:hypothetical protein